MPIDTEQRLAHLETTLRYHTHSEADQTTPLRNLDWVQLGKTTLAAASTSIILENITYRRFLRVFIEHAAKSGSSNNLLRFNNDSSGNYTFINSGAAARTSQTEIDLIDAANNSLGYLYTIDILNLNDAVKPVIAHSVARITSAGTSQTFFADIRYMGKYYRFNQSHRFSIEWGGNISSRVENNSYG